MFIKTVVALLGSAALSACVAPRDFNALMPKTPAYEQVAERIQGPPAADLVQLEQLQNLVRMRLANVALFADGGAQLDGPGKAALAELAPALKALQGKRIVVVGYTDNVPLGTTLGERLSGNVRLTQARAAAVAAFLAAQGVPAALMTPIGLGETHPEASNATAEGRARNQRVAINIVDAPA